ncbi:aspartate-semialdehyde dehydrogenase [Isoalcanivorax beigongshangi]|uniref:Aspartate-semialdehyde dehydrogenase n=1 Tax=Isoalcanivorax beigongshangi TaxID=3238810 RepID=A0ABV4AJW6_9GAMM
MSAQFNLAVVGATGLVGGALLELINELPLPLGEVSLVASAESAGKRLQVREHYVSVAALESFDFSTVQLAIFAVPEAVALQWAPQAADAGVVVVDLSGAFAADTDVPLVVPEVNLELLEDFRNRGIVASPAPASMQLAMTLKSLLNMAGLEQAAAVVLEPAAHYGRAGVDDLARQTARLMNAQEVEPGVFGRQLAFNVLPTIGEPLGSGATRAELRVALETLRLLGEPGLRLSVTIQQVPTFHGCNVALSCESVQPLALEQWLTALMQQPGLRVQPDHEPASAVTDAVGDDMVWLSRLRKDLSREQGFQLSLVTDNLRKGSALNALQIVDLLIKHHLS